MSDPFRRHKVQCITPTGLHHMAYIEWGDPSNPKVLICAHGLTRCARDFDFLAQVLAPHYRVVCPDIAGRGDSDWLKNPMEYILPTYVADMVTLLARLNVEQVDWLGTSMGGIIGMTLASLPESPVRRLVLNDVGPVLTAASLARIGTYVGKAPILPSIEAAEQLVRAVSAPFGPHTDAEWRFLTEHVVRRLPDGNYRMHYDPAIAIPFTASQPYEDMVLWPIWNAIRCPTLAMRGAQSDLLTREILQQMAATGPKAKTVEIAGVGHAPTLIHEDQIAVVKEFLLSA